MVAEASEFCTSSSLPFPGAIYFLVPGTPKIVKLLGKSLLFLLFLPGIIKCLPFTYPLTLSRAAECLYFSLLTPLVWKPM